MTATPLVVLDACVLANFSLCDTLLRLAEPPRLFEPKWSEEIIRETTRTLESKLGWPSSLAAHLEAEFRAHFGEAWISGYESLIPRMTNDETHGGDRRGTRPRARETVKNRLYSLHTWHHNSRNCRSNDFSKTFCSQ